MSSVITTHDLPAYVAAILNISSDETPRYEIAPKKAGGKPTRTNFALYDRGVRTPFTPKGMLTALKGQKAFACFQFEPRAGANLSVHYAVRKANKLTGLQGLGAGFEVATVKGTRVFVSLSEAISLLSGKYAPVSIRAPRLAKELKQLDAMPTAESLGRGYTMDDVRYAVGINRVLNVEARDVRRWFHPKTGAKVNISKMTESEGAEKGFRIIEERVYPNDVQFASPEYILAHCGIAVGRQEGEDIRWMGFLNVSVLAKLITGIEALRPVVRQRTNVERRPEGRSSGVRVPAVASAAPVAGLDVATGEYVGPTLATRNVPVMIEADEEYDEAALQDEGDEEMVVAPDGEPEADDDVPF